jgi:hypothetical protein
MLIKAGAKKTTSLPNVIEVGSFVTLLGRSYANRGVSLATEERMAERDFSSTGSKHT